MFRTAFIMGLIGAASAFAPGAMLPKTKGIRPASSISPRMQLQGTPLIKSTRLTPQLFNKLDKDKSGTIELEELKAAVDYFNNKDVKALFEKADLDKSGSIDYFEYERLMNMERLGDEYGGNASVRFAIKSGLLQPGSVLENSLMVGNKGFDPLNLAKDLDTLNQYREAELKHGRLAMLAAVGWPVSEVANPYIAKLTNSPELLVAGGKAPSLLNGGLDRINPLFFLSVLGFTAAVETFGLKGGFSDREPGDLGFDPLNLYYGSTEDVKASYRLKEVNNGRLAMVAITTYVIEEVLAGINVVTETEKVTSPFTGFSP